MGFMGFSHMLIPLAALFASPPLEGADGGPELGWKTLGEEPPTGRAESCRDLIVGPWKNQPDEYDGYNGFVGWPAVTRLQSGRWVLTFSSGHWHASFPWNDEVRDKCRDVPSCWSRFKQWRKFGLLDLDSPRGGRAHVMHSDDEGGTWSKPSLLVDTELDDRHATILELDDGSFVCTFFSSSFFDRARVLTMRSTDRGKTWSKPLRLPGIGEAFGNGSSVLLPDNTVVLATQFDEMPGMDLPPSKGKPYCGIYHSSDRGKTFELTAALSTRKGTQGEPAITRLQDGRLMVILRRNGDAFWSEDDGKTWSRPRSTGVDLYDPHLVTLPSGVLACFHGSYSGGGLRVILSRDGGETWHGPRERIGYAVDTGVYGYSHPMVLPDGTVYVTYISSGGHRPQDARTMAIWGLRVRIPDSADGIEILTRKQTLNATE